MKLKINPRKVLSIISLMLMISILVAGCSSTSKVPQDAVAVVNGSNISIVNFEKTLALQRMSYEAEFGPDVLNQDMGSGMTLLDSIKQMILDQLVLEEVVFQEAMKDDIEITDEEIDERYTPYIKLLEENKDFKDFAKENDIDEDYIKQQIKKDIVIHKYRDAFVGDLDISEEEAKTYYEENPDFFTKEEVTAKHILVRTAEADEKEKAKKEAEDILSKIKTPEDFLKEWKSYKDAEGEKIIAEDLGSFGRGQMVPEFEEVAFSLEPEEISGIVETSFGYHIILSEDHIKEVSKFEDTKDYLMEYLKEEAFQKNLQELLEKAKITKKEEL